MTWPQGSWVVFVQILFLEKEKKTFQFADIITLLLCNHVPEKFSTEERIGHIRLSFRWAALLEACKNVDWNSAVILHGVYCHTGSYVPHETQSALQHIYIQQQHFVISISKLGQNKIWQAFDFYHPAL